MNMWSIFAELNFNLLKRHSRFFDCKKMLLIQQLTYKAMLLIQHVQLTYKAISSGNVTVCGLMNSRYLKQTRTGTLSKEIGL